MVKMLRSGDFMGILADQRQNSGDDLPFMGHMAKTSLATAELAIRLSIPIVPAFSRRAENGRDVYTEFEAPIPLSDAKTMMLDYHARLEKRIHENPEQWLWTHDRWKL